MKRVLLMALSAAFLLAACNSNSPAKTEEATKEAHVKSAATPPDPLTQKMDELQALSPLGLDELSAWLPNQFNGIKRSNLSMNNDLGYALAHGDYEKNNKTDMRVTVYDCSGQAGADLYKATYADKLKEQSENEDGYTKVIDFMGEKAIEHHEKKNKVTTLTYLANNRILVVVSARNFEPEKVREAAEKLGSKSS